MIIRSLAGLDDVVGLSYVDGRRDGRGWAFREPNGPDPVNGFTLLRQAYDATEPGFDGHVSVPTLWDRSTGTVASNQYQSIGIDLATQFQHLATPLVETYPAHLAAEIDALDGWIGPAVNKGAYQAAGEARRPPRHAVRLLDALSDIERRLATQRFLVGDAITEADVRPVGHARAVQRGPNTRAQIVAGLEVFPNVWAYAHDLYTVPAWASTDLLSFACPAPSCRPGTRPTDRASTSGLARVEERVALRKQFAALRRSGLAIRFDRPQT